MTSVWSHRYRCSSKRVRCFCRQSKQSSCHTAYRCNIGKCYYNSRILKTRVATGGFSYKTFYTKNGDLDMVRTLLCAGADPSIVSTVYGHAREVAALDMNIDILLAFDRHKCRSSLVDLAIGMHNANFPVLVMLEIHDALCSLCGLHEVERCTKEESRLLREGHLKNHVSWEIAKKVKHYLD